MTLRRGDLGLALVAALAAAALVTILDAAERRGREAARDPARAAMRALGLADLCLTTEARYTRHPAQADRFAPFQDLPGAFEYAPSGAWMPPPPVSTVSPTAMADRLPEGAPR